jgi:tetratricopeptide (TPR) repeat protein
MNGIQQLTKILTVLAIWAGIANSASAEATSRLSTRFLARGEQALLEVAVAGVQPAAPPDIPHVDGVEIRQTGRGVRTQLLPGRKLEYVVEYLVSSYATGRHEIPAFDVTAGGLKSRTEALEFTVFNPDELQWSEALAGETKIRYASTFRVMNPRPYDGETTPVEIKLFVPRELFVEDWGIPDFQRDGVTSWRFQPSAMRGQINLLGQPYVSVAYPSTLTPTRTGKVAIGPATIRLMTTQVVMDGILKRISQEVNLAVPMLEMEAQPLPKGAPEGFENAIGNFKLDVSTSVTEAQEGDPIPVDIVVSGSGNLDSLRPPKPADADGWKSYAATTEQRGDERRQLAGRTVFHQFLRPLEVKAAVPSFRLVYFNPKTAVYQTLTTEPIPLRMTPSLAPKPESATPPEALAVPIERMTDILGILRTAPLARQAAPRLPAWLYHIVCGLIATGLVAKALWMRNGYRLRKDPVRKARMQELRALQRLKNSGDAEFLMSAGRFIESWLGGHPSPEIRAVLATRDAVCFQQEKPGGSIMEPKRRHAILKLLRHAAMLWLVAGLLVCATGQARADDLTSRAVAAYDSAKYDTAISLWLQGGPYADLTAETLYNIGNACYRAGSPGHAALYYRRALARDPGHQEARQNLRFIERKCGSITVHRPDYQYALAKFPLDAWRNLLWGGAWMCGLAALVFPATRPGARARVLAFAALIIGPLCLAVGGLGWRYFPNDAEFSPPARQAVIVGEHAILHADAARTSPEVIDAPPGSLCEVIQESGSWVYVAFASQTRGWLPAELIEKIIPTHAPTPPSIRKPKADGKSA